LNCFHYIIAHSYSYQMQPTFYSAAHNFLFIQVGVACAGEW
jgi:hypothetical protein